MEIQIDKAVRRFREFLNSSWAAVSASEMEQDVFGDWLQANWEILVEWRVCDSGRQFLEVYGEGADCNDPSSRVWLPDARATHRIVCVPKQNRSVVDRLSGKEVSAEQLLLDRFVSWDGHQYAEEPPFEFVLVEQHSAGKELLLHHEEVDFEVARFSEDENTPGLL